MSKVAIVDYGLGNLFSVQSACRKVGLDCILAQTASTVEQAEAVILPGVGAFGTAMERLHALDLVRPLQDFADTGKPMLGICLGIQLLFSESYEFGRHSGLGLLPGEVVPLRDKVKPGTRIPQIGWNRLLAESSWEGTLLQSSSPEEYFYFVHSYVVRPESSQFTLATTRYGEMQFCSALQKNNIFACQFHPEKSAEVGLALYRNLARQIRRA